MLNFNEINKYKENNRIEAKRATGGLPESIWETYSAFANTVGGIILLGVEEREDKSLHPLGLVDPEEWVRQFWELVNDPQKVSINILADEDVRIITAEEKKIIVIEIPPAEAEDKPVYLEGNPYTGSYIRNGSGDYHCSEKEVRQMMREQGDPAQDRKVLEDIPFESLEIETLIRYRTRMFELRSGHSWNNLSNSDFLLKIGAADHGPQSEALHPTRAGLLVFGSEYEIVKEFPYYFLDYREKGEGLSGWKERIVSDSGDWSGNLYDFYFRVCDRIASGVTPVETAIKEALANAVIHADYSHRRGLVVEKIGEEICIANPGKMRISWAEAVQGGVADPRNTTLARMFSLVGVGERAGRGLSHINKIWQQKGWEKPALIEQANPDRIILRLKMKTRISPEEIWDFDKKIILDYLTAHVRGSATDFVELLGFAPRRVSVILKELADGDLIVAHAEEGRTFYTLKE